MRRVSADAAAGSNRIRPESADCILAFDLLTASVAITGDIYGHTSDDTARAAVKGLADQLGLPD